MGHLAYYGTVEIKSWSSQYAEKKPVDMMTLSGNTGLLGDVRRNRRVSFSWAGHVSEGFGEAQVHLLMCQSDRKKVEIQEWAGYLIEPL